MIAEFKYSNEKIQGITSLTLNNQDIQKLDADIRDILSIYNIESKYTLISSVDRKSYNNPSNIDFLKFGSPVEAMIIEYNVLDIIDIGIYLSTYEKEIILPGFKSMYNIQSNDENIMILINDYLNKFIDNKKNIHFLFHKHGGVISTFLGVILILMLSKFIELPNYVKLLIIMFVPFYVFTRFFRWVMPYTYFVDENKFKDKLRMITLTVILGSFGSGVWELFKIIITKKN